MAVYCRFKTRVLSPVINVFKPVSLGDELQDVGWHIALVVRLGDELRYAVVCTSDDCLRQTVDGSVHVVRGAVVQRLATGDEVRAIGQKEIQCGGPAWAG